MITGILSQKSTRFFVIFALINIALLYFYFFADRFVIFLLCTSVSVFITCGAILVFQNDPYFRYRRQQKVQSSHTSKESDAVNQDELKIHHPRTHATIALLLLVEATLTIVAISSTASTGEEPPFIFMAFFIGTLGAALGVISRLDIGDARANLFIDHLQEKVIEKSSAEDKPSLLSKNVCRQFHENIVHQIYQGIAIGGVLGVFGLIVVTGVINNPFDLNFKPDNRFADMPTKPVEVPPPFKPLDADTPLNDEAAENKPYVCGQDKAVNSLSCWLSLQPNNYGLLLFICLLFGYSQRLWSSLLNRAEEVAIDYFDLIDLPTKK